MPMYEYRCESCAKTFEVIQKFSDGPLSDCPECGKPVGKLMSLGSFQLKGSGWYNTDYKKPSSSSDSPPSGACGASTEGCGKPACATN
ncbi:MAG: FmdB family zinc ribbon protein [Deltaproteobacteria bacterium]